MSHAKTIQDQLGYKPFMDGLRAISILAVIAYHVGFDQFPGGFIGVDIFFVISGYLICTHLTNSLVSGNFYFGEFWARRALRILPSYFLVIITCLAISPFILVLPKEFIDFGDQVTYSATMLVNHYFLSQQGYFDGLPDTKPLLNLWSLAVEEQFYLITPILLFILHRFLSRFTPLSSSITSIFIVGGIFSISIYGCITMSGNGAGKNYAFFLMPLRAWEFILGGSIAFAVPLAKRLNRLTVELIAGLGLLLIFYSVTTYSGSEIYPSTQALTPVIGACLVILGGIANKKILIARALSIKPMVLIGLVSYSWYLWHWPLLTFGRIYRFGQRDLKSDIYIALFSLFLAVITYVFIEKKILVWRKRRSSPLGWVHVRIAIAACALLALAGAYISYYIGPSIEKSFTQAQVPSLLPGDADCKLHHISSIDKCLEHAGGRPIGLLLGDSHADAAFSRLLDRAKENNTYLTIAASGGCASILNVRIDNPDREMQRRCDEGREKAIKMLSSGELKPSFAILHSRWGLYADERYKLQDIETKLPFPDLHVGFVSKFEETIAYLQSIGVERVLVIGPVPVFDRRAPECVLRADKYGEDREKYCSARRQSTDQSRDKVLSWLKEATEDKSSVRFIDPIDQFCNESACHSYSNEGVLFYDSNHISNAGMDKIYDAYKADFIWAMTGSH